MDTIMLSTMGDAQLSASSLATQFINVFVICCMGIGMGASVLTSRFWGMKDRYSLKKAVTIMLRFCFCFASIFTIATIVAPDWIMRIYSTDGEIIQYGVTYLNWMIPTYICTGFSLTCTIVLRSVGQVRIPLISSIIAFFVNIFFNYVFIFGEFGFPRLEIAGAAVGTLIARAVEFMITFGYLMVIEKNLKYRLKDLFMKIDQALMKEYITIGSPVIVSDGLLTFGNNALAMIMGHMGPSMVSAYAICNVTVQISTVFINGISASSSVITGNTIGKGETEKALNQGYTFFALSVIVGVLGAGIIWLINPLIISFYNITPETVEVTNQLMSAVELIVVFQCIQGVMTKGVLRGGGDTKFLMMADILFLWVASIPLGFLTGLVWEMSPFIVYICLRIDFVIKSFWCIQRLRSGKWIRKAKLIEETKMASV
jgi:putative MATE family efflux protein